MPPKRRPWTIRGSDESCPPSVRRASHLRRLPDSSVLPLAVVPPPRCHRSLQYRRRPQYRRCRLSPRNHHRLRRPRSRHRLDHRSRPGHSNRRRRYSSNSIPGGPRTEGVSWYRLPGWSLGTSSRLSDANFPQVLATSATSQIVASRKFYEANPGARSSLLALALPEPAASPRQGHGGAGRTPSGLGQAGHPPGGNADPRPGPAARRAHSPLGAAGTRIDSGFSGEARFELSFFHSGLAKSPSLLKVMLPLRSSTQHRCCSP